MKVEKLNQLLSEDNTYSVKCFCTNCDNHETITLKKGDRFHKEKCSKCGCNTLVRIFNEFIRKYF